MIRYERPLDLLESAYRLDGTDDQWIAGLRDEGARVFAREGLGAAAFLFTGRPRPDGLTAVDATTSPHARGRGVAKGWRSVVRVLPSVGVPVQDRVFFSGAIADTWSAVTGLGAALPKQPQWIGHSLWNASVANDALGLVGHSGPLGGVVLSVPLRETQPLEEVERRLWRRIAIHIGTALRLRRGVGPVWERAAAVLSPSGRVEHVASPADVPLLREGVARRSRARRRDLSPAAALDVWQGLLDGRWSLVDHIDTDGKAFVLAVQNDPARDVKSALTDRQRSAVALAALGYNNKQIAYSLGLTSTAVAMLLRRARLSARVRSRAELVQTFKRALASGA